jgi:hypothetical protein
VLPLPPVLAVLRHALADPLSAATAKAEVLSARLLRESPALAARAQDLGADLATAGRLLDLLAAIADIAEETPEPTPFGRLVAPFGAVTEAAAGKARVRVRPAAAADAIRRVVAFGAARGGAPRVVARGGPGEVEVLVHGLGPPPGGAPERLLLLPRELPEADDLFVAHAAVSSDGGSLRLSARDDDLEAALSWPGPVEEP